MLQFITNSPRKSALLGEYCPHKTTPHTINVAPEKGELPKQYAIRLVQLKLSTAETGLTGFATQAVLARGRRIIGEISTPEACREYLNGLSNHNLRIYVAMGCVGRRVRVAETRLKIKPLNDDEIERYIASDDWQGYGLNVLGKGQKFIIQSTGSPFHSLGLPSYELYQMLRGGNN